jgi:hypothetical protein
MDPCRHVTREEQAGKIFSFSRRAMAHHERMAAFRITCLRVKGRLLERFSINLDHIRTS